MIRPVFALYYKDALKEVIKSGLPVLLLLISLLYYLQDKADYHLPAWQADFSDSGDYRYVAEHFWGVPHQNNSYMLMFAGHWGYFLDHVPFRQIGVGTLYLLLARLSRGAYSVTVQLETARYLFPLIVMGLLLASYLLFYSACRAVWGWKLALAALACLVFPPRFWAQTEEFLSEPLIRICLVNMLSLIILMQTNRRLGLKIFLFYGLLLLAAHFRAQWFVFGFFILPFFILFFVQRRRYRLVFAGTVLAFFIPFSLLGVNWLGWNYPAVTAGIGLHVNLKWKGALLGYVGQQLNRIHGRAGSAYLRPPVFLQPGEVDSFWSIPFPAPGRMQLPPARELRSDYQLLDKCASAYLLADWKARIVAPLQQGLFLLTNFPAGIWGNSDYIPPPLVFRLIDRKGLFLLAWARLLRETRLLSVAALGLWSIPVTGNVISLFATRYLRPMAMLPLAIALVVSYIVINALIAASRSLQDLVTLIRSSASDASPKM
jgi:hypothetical protein